MALMRNGTSINGIPGRLMGAFAHADIAIYAGMHRRAYFSAFAKTAGIPYGHLSPSSWMLPQKPGAVSSVNNAAVTVTATGSGSMGKAADGAAPITITLTGEGGLISSATGTAAVTVTLDGELFASKAAAGEATLSISADGTLKAIGHLDGDATATVTATWTPYGIGWLEGTTEESGLTPTGVANAVWAKVIEAGFSADQILRLLAAHAAGAATGLEGANPQFTGLDGTTVRIDGTYSAGTRTIDALDGD